VSDALEDDDDVVYFLATPGRRNSPKSLFISYINQDKMIRIYEVELGEAQNMNLVSTVTDFT